MATFDFSEINDLAADLGSIVEEAAPNIIKALAVTGLKTKKDWQDPLKGSASLPGGAAAVSYTVDAGVSLSGGSEFAVEIGPELKGQGALVGMLEYGTPSTGPRGYGAAAAQKNQAEFKKGIDIALEQAERKAGL